MADKKDLLLFQIGPVQEFIVSARTLDDLWSGSYMIAFLTASGMNRLCELAGEGAVIFPCLKKQTVYERVTNPTGDLGQPTIPNRFCAEVDHDKAKHFAEEIKKTIIQKFYDISSECYKKFAELFPKSGDSYRQRWDDQIQRFLQFSWQTVPLNPQEWGKSYGELLKNLAARRNTRDFMQYRNDGSTNGTIKDALNGQDEIVGDLDEWTAVKNVAPFSSEDKPYGAISMVKRLWRKEFLMDGGGVGISLKELADRSEIEATRYIAAIQMDGDHMGEILSDTTRGKAFFNQFSQKLANFACNEAQRIVEGHDGVLVYAGGDDVLALLPACRAIDCARELRNKFCEKNSNMPGSECGSGGQRVTLSAGIAFCHYKTPLSRLLTEARRAEHRAKEELGRDALAITIVKRSGEIAQWGAKFDSPAWDAYKEFYAFRQEENPGEAVFSSRFASSLAKLVLPYTSDNARRSDGDLAVLKKIIEEDFDHVCRQQQNYFPKTEEEKEKLASQISGFKKHAKDYLNAIESQNELQEFPKMFLCASFLMRKHDEDNQ